MSVDLPKCKIAVQHLAKGQSNSYLVLMSKPLRLQAR